MNARWAGIVLLVAVGCWGARVEPPEDDTSKDENKGKVEKKLPPKEDPGAVAAMLKLQKDRQAFLKRDLRAPGKPIISVQLPPMMGPPGSDPRLKHLSGLAHLRELIIQNSDVPIELIAELERLPDLKALTLVYAGVNDEKLLAISRLKNLEVLRIPFSALTAKGLAHLEKMTALRELNLIECRALTDEQARHLAKLTKLQVLALRGCPITDAALDTLAQLKALERLELESCGKVSDAGMKKLAGLKSLKVLNLGYTGVGDEGLAALEGLPLEELSLNKENTDPNETPRIRLGAKLDRFPELRKVDLRSVAVGEPALAALARLPRLRELDLYDTGVGDDALDRLKEMKNLRKLDVSKTRITSKGLARMVEVPLLDKVTVTVVEDGDRDMEITQEAADEFRKANPKIKVSQ
jgi:hypothetical protein